MSIKHVITAFVALGLVVGISVSVWAAKQPHMHAAMESLTKARTQLEKADPDKGGHREAAIKLVDQAMIEVKAGIEFANTH